MTDPPWEAWGGWKGIMEPYIPIYARSPNTLIRYEDRQFCDGAGHSGVKRVAIFAEKNGRQQEMVARVLWDDA